MGGHPFLTRLDFDEMTALGQTFTRPSGCLGREDERIARAPRSHPVGITGDASLGISIRDLLRGELPISPESPIFGCGPGHPGGASNGKRVQMPSSIRSISAGCCSERAVRSPFFLPGGTLPLDAPSYIRRRADDELYALLRQGEFCYILTSRQMGKSSLMVHVSRGAPRSRRSRRNPGS